MVATSLFVDFLVKRSSHAGAVAGRRARIGEEQAPAKAGAVVGIKCQARFLQRRLFATAKSRGAEMQRAISTYSGEPYRDEALQGWIRRPCGRRAIERGLWRDSRGVALTEYLVVLGGCVLLAIPAINGLSSALRETSGVEGQRIASLTFSPGNATPAPGIAPPRLALATNATPVPRINQPMLALAANATPAPALTPPP